MIKDIVNKSYNIDFYYLNCSLNCNALNLENDYCLVFETYLEYDTKTDDYQRCESCINKWGKDD